jgi:hypothetical protein
MTHPRRPLLKRVAIWTAAIVLLLVWYVASFPFLIVACRKFCPALGRHLGRSTIRLCGTSKVTCPAPGRTTTTTTNARDTLAESWGRFRLRHSVRRVFDRLVPFPPTPSRHAGVHPIAAGLMPFSPGSAIRARPIRLRFLALSSPRLRQIALPVFHPSR